MKITDINTEDIDTLWPFVEDFLQSALDQGQGEFELEDIHLCLITGLMRLWIAYDINGNIVASATTEIKQFPRKKVCFVVLLGGKDIDDWLHGSLALEQWARENGADAIVAYTRRGLAKKLKDHGYREVYTVVQQDLVQRRLH